MSTRTYYELLGVEPTADTDTIKKAFRREIARYHPDKVAHLGQDLQAVALQRSEELTAAYKTLTHADSRANYDARLGDDAHVETTSPAAAPPPAPPPPAAAPTAAAGEEAGAEPVGDASRFQAERANRDYIVRRAVLRRVRDVMQDLVTDCDTTPIAGFDLVCLARKGSSNLFRRGTSAPSVVVSFAPVVDRQTMIDAWRNAVRARIAQKPLVLLLIGDQLAPTAELARAVLETGVKNPTLRDAWFPIAVDIKDFTAKIPNHAPQAVHSLMDRLRTFMD